MNADSPTLEKLNYGVSCPDIDFGLLNARNQLISKVINPLLDKALDPLKQDRALRGGTGSGQRYTVNVVIVAERELEAVQ